MATSTKYKILNVHDRGITLVSNTIILDNSQSSDDSFLRCANSYLLYDNLIYSQNATITSAQEGAGADSAGVLALKDGNSNLKWYSNGNLQVDIDVTLPLSTKINCMSVAGANLREALVSWDFFVFDPVAGNFKRVAQGSGKKDNSPIFLVFDEIETPTVRFRFFAQGVLRVGELGCGKALRFPRAPDVGYSPAKWQSDKVAVNKVTEGNSVANSNVLNTTILDNPKYSLIDTEWVDEYWPDVVEKATGTPVWFAWNQSKEPHNVVFGKLNTEIKPAYDNSLLSSIDLQIKGVK